MTMFTPETAPLPHHDPGSQGHPDISLARIYLPFAMVIAFGIFLAVSGYTAAKLCLALIATKPKQRSG